MSSWGRPEANWMLGRREMFGPKQLALQAAYTTPAIIGSVVDRKHWKRWMVVNFVATGLHLSIALRNWRTR